MIYRALGDIDSSAVEECRDYDSYECRFNLLLYGYGNLIEQLIAVYRYI